MKHMHKLCLILMQCGYTGILAAVITVSAVSYANVNPEELGVINGSVVHRDAQTEFTPFLSGRPLFQYDVGETQPAITQIQIEYVKLLTGLATTGEEAVWIQSSVELVDDDTTTAPLQLPIQVNVNGHLVKVNVRENSRGVIVTLPQAARQVIVQPAGAIRLTVPNTYRGEVRADIRMLEILPTDRAID